MAQPHVVIFPYDEQSHINSAFALGRALACRGMHVTGLLSATRYAHSSSSTLRGTAADESSLFQVKVIPDNGEVGDGGIDDIEVYFKQYTLQGLERGVEEVMQRLQPRPSCLISDFLYPWSHDLAGRLCLPCFQFSVVPAITILIALHLPTFIAKGLLPFKPGMEDEVVDFIPGLPKGFQFGDIPMDLFTQDNKHVEVLLRVQSGLRRGAVLLINTVYELEPDILDGISMEGLSVYAVGPLSSMDWEGKYHLNASLYVEEEGCLRWLDTQRCSTVVYAAFGSIISLSKEEIEEVAFGLEACGQPFLWVLRGQPPSRVCGDGVVDNPMSALPAGFLERTKERGRVAAWAPQPLVLSHSSIGCFISHCGMSSVLEALWAGVPMIGGFCKISDQNTVFRIVTKDWGVAMALADGGGEAAERVSAPLRTAVERCVKEVMHGERGVALSQKVGQLKSMIRKAVQPEGSSYLSLMNLVNAVTSQNFTIV
eukprot:c24254_g1_i3 orf=114-1562(+)